MSASSIHARFFHEIAARAADSLADVRHPLRRHILADALESYQEAQVAMASDDQAALDPFFERVRAALEGSA